MRKNSTAVDLFKTTKSTAGTAEAKAIAGAGKEGIEEGDTFDYKGVTFTIDTKLVMTVMVRFLHYYHQW
ncbi:hypothetical protein KCP71_17045 [Salmonella enterica subsp. enterica]|nr:hypothetical protein KCP71_17045 [Salmonella enterica subsp. enterica]